MASGNSVAEVVLVGGAENSVAAARSLLAQGVRVTAVAEPSACVHKVRGVASEIVPEASVAEFDEWLDRRGGAFRGAVALALSDTALLAIAGRHDDWSGVLRLPAMAPTQIADLLDKERTLELAAAAGVGVPLTYTLDEIEKGEVAVQYPVLVKPRHTFELLKRVGRKFLWVEGPDDAREHMETVRDLPGGAVFMEFIPGGDEQLCSYYEYRSGGVTHAAFTKRIERRFPPNQGGATCHELVDLPDVAEAGRRFFDGVGLEGIGNVEFKRDPRTGELKIIECNCRLTAATAQIQAAGIDLVGVLVDDAAGEPVRPVGRGRPIWYWYPVRDLRSVLAGDEWTFRDWLSVARRRPVMPYWSAADPGPSVRHALNILGRIVANRVPSR